ncbi:ArsA family ATPase [Leptolyngbya sp. FACHB-261]|uniref:ArsA family ATPase n=1 Tax=Leptolyngbya sp. FACHB-261 TaxID=2692806 RepID=UPI001F553689|nr:TRC40/GET3/ArsA family transport-energizing ATPase [Leptolyngbya sp. FACHB-261]
MKTPQLPLSPDCALLLFSGKGGVGKTTLACGLARQLAATYSNQRYLLISTDPAHSLGDVLGLSVTDQPQPLADLPNLQVRSLDAQALLQTFRATYGEALELIAERGSWFDREDLLPVWDLDWPGLDELMAVLEVNRLLAAGEADTVILDTAPTGHTLRLLDLPDFLDNLLGSLALFQGKHQELSMALTGSYHADQADAFLEKMTSQLSSGRDRLSDSDKSAVWLVLTPEQLSLMETRRFCNALEGRRVPIGGLIVNQVIQTGRSTFHSSSLLQARHKRQQEILQILATELSRYPVWQVPLQAAEPLREAALDALIAQIQPLKVQLPAVSTAPLPPLNKPDGRDQVHNQAPLLLSSITAETTVGITAGPRLPNFLKEGKRLIVVGGKGGVGKTTTAATIAFHLARSLPQARVLVASIDPAHSLGDAFQEAGLLSVDQALGQEPYPVLPNLWAQEVEAEQILEEFRRDYLRSIAAMLSGEIATEQEADAGVSLQYDPQAWQKLLDLPPPGLDEVMALLSILKQVNQATSEPTSAYSYDLVVLDTAPTGHLLRFLQMPHALEGWIRMALRLWLKYREVVAQADLAQRLRGLLQQVRQLQQQLQSPNDTEFISVMTPEQAVLAETQRLLIELDHLKICHRFLVLNRLWEDCTDPLGQALSERHQKMAEQLRQHSSQQIISVPFLERTTLAAMAEHLF